MNFGISFKIANVTKTINVQAFTLEEVADICQELLANGVDNDVVTVLHAA